MKKLYHLVFFGLLLMSCSDESDMQTPELRDDVIFLGAAGNLNAENRLLAVSVNDGTTIWDKTFSDGRVEPRFVIYDIGTIYFLDGKLTALNASDGSVKWRIDVPSGKVPDYDNGFYQDGVIVKDGVVYASCISDSKNYFLAIDGNKGVMKWSFETKRFAPKFSISENKLVYSDDLELVALDLQSGNVIYKKAIVSQQTLRFSTDLLIENGLAYIGYDGALLVFKTTDGSFQWEKPYSNPRDITIVDSKLFFTSDERLVALDRISGNLVDESKLGLNSPLLQGTSFDKALNLLITSDYYDERPRAFNMSDFTIKWEQSYSGYSAFYNSDDQYMYAGRGGILYAINKTDGSTVWEVDLSATRLSVGTVIKKQTIYQPFYSVGN